MTVTARSARPRSFHWTPRLFPLLVILAAVAGCAAAPRIDVPAELPLQTNDQIFTIRWALQRETSVVRAVGRTTFSMDAQVRLTLALFGLDARGGIVSRGMTYLQPEFGSRSIPFTVELTPTGREVSFELRVLNYYVPGLRSS